MNCLMNASFCYDTTKFTLSSIDTEQQCVVAMRKQTGKRLPWPLNPKPDYISDEIGE